MRYTVGIHGSTWKMKSMYILYIFLRICIIVVLRLESQINIYFLLFLFFSRCLWRSTLLCSSSLFPLKKSLDSISWTMITPKRDTSIYTTKTTGTFAKVNIYISDYFRFFCLQLIRFEINFLSMLAVSSYLSVYLFSPACSWKQGYKDGTAIPRC